VVLKKEAYTFLHDLEDIFGYDIRPQFKWESRTSIDLLITMKQTYTLNEARQLTEKQRKCIFPDDNKRVSYYREANYSVSYCLKECRMKKAIKLCKCSPPFYAPYKSENKAKCGIEDLECLAKDAFNITGIKDCECELCCYNTVYDVEKYSKK
jgi:acid-sensing ion channel, other